MTLSPVFRSDDAVRVLRTAQVWSRLDPAARGQRDAIGCVKRDLPKVLDAAYIDASDKASRERLVAHGEHVAAVSEMAFNSELRRKGLLVVMLLIGLAILLGESSRLQALLDFLGRIARG